MQVEHDPMRTWDALTTARAIATGEVSAAEAVGAAIERARCSQSVLGALVVMTPDSAMAAAAAADRRRARGRDLPLLAGVPSAVKDLSDQSGVPTRQGSRAISNHVPAANGVEVDEFLSSGLVSIGKSATPEFGFVPTTEPLFGDPTRNPWSPSHSSGGSSGGAAALVAAGVVPIAHATDGGGSIRIPAAINGLVGLKPTVDRHARMDKMAHLPIKVSVSNVVSRTVADTAAHMAAVERFHRNTRLPPVGHVLGPASRRVRIGVVEDGPNAPTAAPIRAAVRRTADLLADLGHDVQDLPWSVGEQFTRDFVLYWGTLAMITVPYLRRELRANFEPELLDPFTVTLARHARDNVVRIPLAVRRLRHAIAPYGAAFRRVDVMLSPTVAQPTPVIGATAPTLPFDELIGWLMDFVQFTPVHNVTGAPAISLPAGQHQGLPIGVQLGALPGDDRTLLELAYEVEAAAPWPLLAPWPPAVAPMGEPR